MEITVYLHEGTGTHGCTDGLVVRFEDEHATVGTITAVFSCRNCWQVGHDSDHGEQRGKLLGAKVVIPMVATKFAEHVTNLTLGQPDEFKGPEESDGICLHWNIPSV